MKYRKLDLNEMMEYVNGIIGTTENKFCNDCIYENKKEESYYIELCIEKYISFFNNLHESDRYTLFEYLYPDIPNNEYANKLIAERYSKDNLNLVEPEKQPVSTILCISNKTFFEDLRKILDNKDKGIEESVTLANIEDNVFNSKNGLYVGPTG